MANKYFNVDKSPFGSNSYFITYNAIVHEAVKELKKNPPFSYQQIVIALFGLKPSDFFGYIQTKYKAKISTAKESRWRTISFENLQDAWAFAKECERRFEYCIQNDFFKE